MEVRWYNGKTPARQMCKGQSGAGQTELATTRSHEPLPEREQAVALTRMEDGQCDCNGVEEVRCGQLLRALRVSCGELAHILVGAGERRELNHLAPARMSAHRHKVSAGCPCCLALRGSRAGTAIARLPRRASLLHHPAPLCTLSIAHSAHTCMVKCGIRAGSRRRERQGAKHCLPVQLGCYAAAHTEHTGHSQSQDRPSGGFSKALRVARPVNANTRK